jgi:hypothetical protein
MDTIEDWGKYINLTRKTPVFSNETNKNHIEIIGFIPYSNTGNIKDTNSLPNEFSQVSNRLEETLKEHYPCLNIEGIQSFKQAEGKRTKIIRALIKGVAGEKSDLGILLRGNYPVLGKSIRDAYISFTAVLPVEVRYYLPTENFLEKFWLSVVAVECDFPKPPEIKKKGPNFQKGAILLIEKGVAIATGHGCFRKLEYLLPTVRILEKE